MAIKRKAVAKRPSSAPGKRSKAAKKNEEPEVEAEQKRDQDEVEDPEEVEEEDEEEEEEDEEESEEDRILREEQETTVARKKELKAMYLDVLKSVATRRGVAVCKKELMLDLILKHEVEERAEIRARKARVRQVLVSKKEELEAMGLPELKRACTSCGVNGQLTKQARIEMMIKQWQEADGVDNALAKMARDKREGELTSLGKPALLRLCGTAGIDPFVKEVIVERIVAAESKKGRFARPASRMETLPDDHLQEPSKKVDIVDALLANEEHRKKEKELRRQEEEAAEGRRKELRALPVDGLKKQLAKQGVDTTGKKDELVEALLIVRAHEEVLVARRGELRALGHEKLRALLELNEVDIGKGKVNDMVDSFLAGEAKMREMARLYEVKVAEAIAERKAELEKRQTAELKDMCARAGVKAGVGREVHVERLLEDLKANALADIEKSLAMKSKASRREELTAMDKGGLLRLAEAMEIDTLVREVMVERLVAHEEEFGLAIAGGAAAKKKARRS